MTWSALTVAPPDPILGLTEAFIKDSRSYKVNLGVGVYVDENGRTPILDTVRTAERLVWEEERSKSYLGIAGEPQFALCVRKILFPMKDGEELTPRVRTAQTPGGTGALRVGAEFLKMANPSASAWHSRPTWANHAAIFQAAGYSVHEYPYYRADHGMLDFDGMCKALEKIPCGDIVLLHVCCHNPTGVDPTLEQWDELARIAADKCWVPFFDFAYQGFGSGLDEDARPLIPFLRRGVECLIASSFSKNFGLYCERVGALTVVAADTKSAEAAFSHIKIIIRRMYSNPPAHGARIVTRIWNDAVLEAQWREEVSAMRNRIYQIRAALVEGLARRGCDSDFEFLWAQRGMFSFTGLNDEQVKFLQEQKAIYMVKGGRINVAGINRSNLDYVCDSLVEALRRFPRRP